MKEFSGSRMGRKVTLDVENKLKDEKCGLCVKSSTELTSIKAKGRSRNIVEKRLKGKLGDR